MGSHFIKNYLLLSLFFVLVVKPNLIAQENNYWYHQYGAKSSLLCGAAVATYFDNGAIYYNPATLCFKDSGNIALSANLYNAEILNRKNALGEGLDLKSSNFNFSPQIVSGNRKIGKNIELEFILLSRTDVQFNQNLSFNKIYNDTLLFYSNNSLYVASYNYRKRVLDEWAGLSISFNLTEKIGFGIASFVSYRFSRYFMEMNASSIGLYQYYQPVSKSDSSISISSNTISLINKIGLVYQGDKNNFGIALTLPSIPIYGNSQLEYSIFINDPNNIVQPRDVYMKRSNLQTQFKYPLSCSIGFSRKLKRSKLHLTSEYFSPISKYKTVDVPVTLPDINSGDVVLNAQDIKSFEEAKRNILNFAIGWERVIKGKTELLLGFATDFNSKNSYWDGISQVNYALNQEDFNIYHFSAGVGFQHKKNNIAVGLITSKGGGTTQQFADFQNPTAFSKFFGFNYNTMFTYFSSYGIVVGLTY
jgi:hypothetical protein